MRPASDFRPGGNGSALVSAMDEATIKQVAQQHNASVQKSPPVQSPEWAAPGTDVHPSRAPMSQKASDVRGSSTASALDQPISFWPWTGTIYQVSDRDFLSRPCAETSARRSSESFDPQSPSAVTQKEALSFILMSCRPRSSIAETGPGRLGLG